MGKYGRTIGILGDRFYGPQIIDIFVSLGTVLTEDTPPLLCSNERFVYFKEGDELRSYTHEMFPVTNVKVYTFKSFNDAFPYRVGDRIITIDICADTICEMKWDRESEQVLYRTEAGKWYCANDIIPNPFR